MNSPFLIFFVFAVVAVNARATVDKLSPKAIPKISSDEMFRLYEKAEKEVDELNKKYPDATFAINKFSFMSESERKKYLSVSPSLSKILPFDTFDDENITAPASFDWREYGKVTPVKDQSLSRTSTCGSCYAFAATAAVESQYLIQKNQTLDLSEEYVLECDKPDYECQGGFAEHAFDVYQTSGVPAEECDPYTGTNGTCPDVSASCEVTKIAGYKTFGQDEDKYPGLLSKYGPIAIAMKAASNEFYNYKGGILNYPIDQCGSYGHAVLLVGYTEDYWIAKNSWGSEKWGEDGYFRFKRGINFCDFTKRDTPAIPYLTDPAATTTASP